MSTVVFCRKITTGPKTVSSHGLRSSTLQAGSRAQKKQKHGAREAAGLRQAALRARVLAYIFSSQP